MERREQYDPEDIESLLQERGFDELLEEERAYVLRHLSGREEYEQMRALLLHVQQNERVDPPIEMDDRIRENVMQAFRAQQQPQWKLWLNTIGGVFTPGEGFAMWRPALAIGMILLLFGVGFFLIRGPIADEQRQLAEVRRQKAEEPIPAKKAEVTDTNSASKSFVGSDTSTDQRSNEVRSEIAAEQAAPALEEEISTGSTSVEAVAGTAPQMDIAAVTEEPVIEEKEIAADETHTKSLAEIHVVTEAEMMQNQSVANATGKVKSRPTKDNAPSKSIERTEAYSNRSASSRSLAEDPQLMDLLSAGW